MRSPRKVRSTRRSAVRSFRHPRVRRNTSLPTFSNESGGTTAVIFPINPFALGIAAESFSVKERYGRYRTICRAIVKACDSGIKPGALAKIFPNGEEGLMNEDALADFFEQTFAVSGKKIKFINDDIELQRMNNPEFDKLLGLVERIAWTPALPPKDPYLPLGLQEEFVAAGWSSTPADFGILNNRFSEVLSLRQMDAKAYDDVEVMAPSIEVESADTHGQKYYFLLNGPIDGNSYSLAPLSFRANDRATAYAVLKIILESGLWSMETGSFVPGARLTFGLPIDPSSDEEDKKKNRLSSHVNTFVQELANLRDMLNKVLSLPLSEDKQKEFAPYVPEGLPAEVWMAAVSGSLDDLEIGHQFFIPFMSSEDERQSYLGGPIGLRDISAVRRAMASKFFGDRPVPPTLFMINRLANSSTNPKFRDQAARIRALRSSLTMEARAEKDQKQVEAEEQRALGTKIMTKSAKERNYFPLVPVTVIRPGPIARAVHPLREMVFTVYGLLNPTNVQIMSARNKSLGGSEDDLIDPAYRAYKSGINSQQQLDKTLAEGFEKAVPVTHKEKEGSSPEPTRVAHPSSSIINVMFKGGPAGSNTSLSNLARRPFTFDGRQYQSVEHAYQTLKNNFDPKVYGRPDDFVGQKKGAPKLKRDLGNTDRLMLDLVRASFQQNPTAAMDLLATGDARFTHVSTSGRTDHWTTAFPQILEQVRAGLRAATSAPNPRNRHAARYRSVLNPHGFGRGRRNPSEPQYGIFYQTRMTKAEVNNAIALERAKYLSQPIQIEDRAITPWPDFPIDYMASDEPDVGAIRSGDKYFVTHMNGLPAGRVIKFGLPTSFGPAEMYARSRGSQSFAQFVQDMSRYAKDGMDPTYYAINAWVQGSGLPFVDNRPYASVDALLNAVTSEGFPVLDLDTTRQWILGERDAVVYDLSAQPSFVPLLSDFSPYLALRKVICEKAWISESNASNGNAATSIYENDEAQKLQVPFSIFGVLKADTKEVAELDRDLPKAYIPDEKAPSIGLYTFNIRVPAEVGQNNPSQTMISTLHGSEQDGVKALKFTYTKFEQVMRGLVQCGFNVMRAGLAPLIGTENEQPDIFRYANVCKSAIWDKVAAKISDKEAEKVKPRSDEQIKLIAYYAVIKMAVQSSSKPVTDENADFQRVGYFSVGGSRFGAKEDVEAKRRQWATEDRFFTNSVYDLIFQFMNDNYNMPVYERTTVMSALRGTEILPPATLPSEEEPDTLFSELARTQGRGTSIPAVRKFIEDVRRGSVPSAWLDNPSPFGLYPNQNYLISVAGTLMSVSTVEQLEHEGQYSDYGLTLYFEPVTEDSKEIRLLNAAARSKIQMPNIDPDVKDDPMEELQRKLANVRAQKAALLKIRDSLDNNYRHRMDIGLLRDRLSQHPAIAAFALPFLEDLAKPNPRRNPRGRRNPIENENLLNLLAEYAEGQLSDDQALDLKTSLQTWVKDQDPSKWAVNRLALDQMFPSQGMEKPDKWAPRTRVTEGLGRGGHNLVSRLRRMEYEEADRAAAVDASQAEVPFKTPRGKELLARQAELSLDEAKQMLAFQREAVRRRGREGSFSIQASSALCKTYRKRRLSNFGVPENIQQFFQQSKELPAGPLSTILILMSPRATEPVLKPRVMVWRRGDHIDCDLLGNSAEDMTEMLGKAIQATMYWLAEKPVRRQEGKYKSYVFVARVGDHKLYKAWSPGDDITIAKITENLSKDPITLEPTSGEVERYLRAERELQIGTFKPEKKAKKAKPTASPSAAVSVSEETEEIEERLGFSEAPPPPKPSLLSLEDLVSSGKIRNIVDLSSGSGEVFASTPDAATELGSTFKLTHEVEGQRKVFEAKRIGKSLKYQVREIEE